MDPTSSRRTQQAQYYFAGEHAQEREYAQVRERRHSTLCALMDPELLMMHSVSKSETTPQTRQRLLGELIGTAAAAEYDVPDDEDEDEDEDGEKDSNRNGDPMDINGSDRGGSTPKPKPAHRVQSQPQTQLQMRFGDQVVVNVVEREDGWVVNDGKGKGKAKRESGGGRSVSGSESGSGSGHSWERIFGGV